MIQAGQLLLLEETAWLAEFESELLGFPNARFDDQVDAVAQLLIWIRTSQSFPRSALGAPICFWTDDEAGGYEVNGDFNDGAMVELF